jgi:hypothetical protein
MLKTYPYIVVDKSNMGSLRHFPTAQRVADFMFGASSIPDRFVILKGEKRVVNLEKLRGVGGDSISIHKKVLSVLLEEG